MDLPDQVERLAARRCLRLETVAGVINFARLKDWQRFSLRVLGFVAMVAALTAFVAALYCQVILRN